MFLRPRHLRIEVIVDQPAIEIQRRASQLDGLVHPAGVREISPSAPV